MTDDDAASSLSLQLDLVRHRAESKRWAEPRMARSRDPAHAMAKRGDVHLALQVASRVIPNNSRNLYLPGSRIVPASKCISRRRDVQIPRLSRMPRTAIYTELRSGIRFYNYPYDDTRPTLAIV
jgi:hypothetical protein